MKSLQGRFALVALIVPFVSCTADRQRAPVGVAPGELTSETVVATVSGRKVTLGEVDALAGSKLADLDKRKYEIRKNALDQLVVQSLVKAEATKKGITEDEWLKAEIEAKVPPPTDEAIEKTFTEAKSNLPPGAKLEDFRERIITFMTQDKRQELAHQKFDELKKAANVELKLPEPAASRVKVEPKGPSRGPEGAKVTIVEFSDFQCPFCVRAHDTVEQVMQAYPGKVRLVFRHFPLAFHEDAPKAAEAAACAGEQGKFWEYHDLLFKNQKKLKPADLKEHAASMGLDAPKFGECLESAKHAQTVKDDMAAGGSAGVSGTPAFFINGVMLSGALPFEDFKKVIDQELAAN